MISQELNIGHYPKSSLNILVVDDETGMTTFLEKALIKSGHLTTVFNDSLEALIEFKNNPDAFDLAITDQLMSRMTGLELTQELLKIRSQFPVLIYAGVNDEVRTKMDLPAGNVFLLKRPAPFEEITAFLNTIQPKIRQVAELKTPLFCLIYVSRVADNFTETDLIDILKVARRENKKLGITGVIIFHAGCFLQMLEGDFSAINKLFYEHICQDERHHNVVTLFQEYRENREFPDWNMAFYGDMKEMESSLLGSYTNLNTHSAAQFLNQKLIAAQQLLKMFSFNNVKS